MQSLSVNLLIHFFRAGIDLWKDLSAIHSPVAGNYPYGKGDYANNIFHDQSPRK